MTLTTGMQLAAAGAQAAGRPSPAAANPYSPACHHAYRRGLPGPR